MSAGITCSSSTSGRGRPECYKPAPGQTSSNSAPGPFLQEAESPWANGHAASLVLRFGWQCLWVTMCVTPSGLHSGPVVQCPKVAWTQSVRAFSLTVLLNNTLCNFSQGSYLLSEVCVEVSSTALILNHHPSEACALFLGLACWSRLLLLLEEAPIALMPHVVPSQTLALLRTTALHHTCCICL